MSDEFDALLEKGHAKEGPSPERVAQAKAAQAASRNRVAQDALAGEHGLLGSAGPMLLVGVAVVAAFYGLRTIGLPRWAAQVAIFSLIAAAGAGLFVAFKFGNRALAGYERRRLEALPFKVGVEDYLAALGSKRKTGRAVVTLQFTGEPDEAARGELTTAMDGLTRTPIFTDVVEQTTDVEWTGSTLRITGPRVATHSSHPGEPNPERYGNARVHKWVRRFLAKGVRPVHGRHPVDAVSISVREF